MVLPSNVQIYNDINNLHNNLIKFDNKMQSFEQFIIQVQNKTIEYMESLLMQHSRDFANMLMQPHTADDILKLREKHFNERTMIENEYMKYHNEMLKIMNETINENDIYMSDLQNSLNEPYMNELHKINHAIHKNKYKKAATSIQKMHRGKSARSKTAQKLKAATSIQKMFRGKSARSKTAKMRTSRSQSANRSSLGPFISHTPHYPQPTNAQTVHSMSQYPIQAPVAYSMNRPQPYSAPIVHTMDRS